MTGQSSRRWNDLALRAASGLVLAAVALASIWLGGVPCLIVWSLAAVLVMAEWLHMTTGRWQITLVSALAALWLFVAALFTFAGHTSMAILVVIAGAICLFFVSPDAKTRRYWALSVPYASCVVLPIVALRGDAGAGLTAIAFIFAVVWGSDIFAYLCGRAIGGPKLWPAVSPKKTWAGFIGGTVIGALAAVAVGMIDGRPPALPLFLLALVLAVISQGGDLLESSMKRRFGIKDSSNLIPGHGGVMDRLDGFAAAAIAALIFGLLRDAAHPAYGLLFIS